MMPDPAPAQARRDAEPAGVLATAGGEEDGRALAFQIERAREVGRRKRVEILGRLRSPPRLHEPTVAPERDALDLVERSTTLDGARESAYHELAAPPHQHVDVHQLLESLRRHGGRLGPAQDHVHTRVS